MPIAAAEGLPVAFGEFGQAVAGASVAAATVAGAVVAGSKRVFEAAFGDEDTRPYEPVFNRSRMSGPMQVEGGLEAALNRVAAGTEINQFTRGKSKFGRAVSKWEAKRRLEKKENIYAVCMFGRLTRFASPITTLTGVTSPTLYRSFQLLNWSDANDPSRREYPLHLIDLTSRFQTTNPTNCAWFLEDAAGGIGFAPLTGIKPDGTTMTTNMSLWATNDKNEWGLQQAEKSFLKDARIDITMQGCIKFPVDFFIDVIKITDEEDCHPDTAAQSLLATNMYRRIAKRLITHPCSRQQYSNDTRGRIRYLYSRVFHFAPETTTSADTNAGQRHQSFRFNLNQMCDWSWRFDAGEASLANVENPNSSAFHELPPYSSQIGSLAKKNERIYLMIRATSWAEIQTANKPTFDPDAQTSTLTQAWGELPQYDLRVYCRHFYTPKPDT